MPILRYGEQRVLFIHIPKTGGTAIEFWLRQIGQLDFFEPASSDGFRVSPQHLTMADHLALSPTADWDFAFAVIRNPYDRIRSEYHWRTGIEYRASGVWPNYSNWVERALRDAVTRHPTLLDNHIRPQFDFLGETVEVFRYEDGLEEARRAVCKLLGVESPADELPHLRVPESHSTASLSPRALLAVNRFYAADFEFLGYDLVRPRIKSPTRLPPA
jgi:hypothetical protein